MAPVKSAEKDKDRTANGDPKPRRRPGRVPVSCAECRRLKLRCDRKVPCETCVKRGCAAICPEGSLTTGKGNRLALADAEELHKKIEQLRSRSTALEDALRSLQAAVSDEPHALLQDDAVAGAAKRSRFWMHLAHSPLDCVANRGSSGHTSRSEYLIHAPEKLQPMTNVAYPRLSQEFVDEANKELDIPCDNVGIAADFMRILPPLSQACHLCEIFLEYGQFIWYPIPRSVLFDEIVGAMYRSNPATGCNLASTHAAALLFMVFALATLFDPALPPYSVEAYEYYLLARVALRWAPPAHDTTLISIQTMIYMTQYLEMSDCEPAHTGSHKAWLQIGLAVKLGIVYIGLHVSSSRWKLSELENSKRSCVFWQLFLQDTWLSFGFGRPPSMSLAFIDVEMPPCPEDQVNESGQRQWGFHQWTWRYTRLLHTVITTAFGAKMPQYSTILDLDRRMQRLLATIVKETTLLNIHRPYFSQALSDQPHDLLRHRYGPSVMAIYRSAWRLLAVAKEAYRVVPTLAGRLGLVWSHSLAGGIVMCLLVTRAPSSNLAQSSLAELDKLCVLFEEAANTCQIARNNLDVVRKLRRQGHEAMDKTHAQGDSAMTPSELDRLGGRTHLISETEERQLPIHCHNTPAVQSTATPAFENAIPQELIHPTIMQDLRTFDGVMDASFDSPQLNLDFPSTIFPQGSLEGSDFSSFPEFDFSGSMFTTHQPPLQSPEVPPGPPVLDATWQAFVEQLGF
ncbi:putative transcriptional regulatory protein C1F7.11c [Grifola frondosa]|uniref:Putative transcriptional regulatory protein C1F7.11c n=1 Tax=Grifola frondosa TaxID=5627 RepID=A0A1C7MQB6_GRIFR|nr:putative transcriptional regulatory protein C1F7.11c [Grifola frondosa]